MFDITQVSDQNQMSPVYLFIQIQILIGFQPNRFVTKYSQKKHQSVNLVTFGHVVLL
jgi:hypothetical protein